MNKKNKIHFIGAAGVSMSALRALADRAGFQTTGSDLKNGGHAKENIHPDLDLVVYTASITPGSPGFVELGEARKQGIKTVSRGEYLANLVNRAKHSIVVSGMHGKTTVTTMIGLILKEAGMNPTVLPGTFVKEFSANYLAGDSDLIVSEGCEYFDAFLNLKPKIAVITNIEEEHLDYFNNLDNIIQSFARFIENIDPNGVLIYQATDKNIGLALSQAQHHPQNIIAYGKQGELKYQKLGFNLSIPGEHNRENALAAEAVADFMGVKPEVIKSVLMDYKGAGRRMEIKGQIKGITVIDDYGHHPTEIKATIRALREFYPNKRLVVAFWPHQHKRIAALFNDFKTAFNEVDELLLLPIYFVPGRDEKVDISSEKLAKAIEGNGFGVRVFPDEDNLVDFLLKEIKEGDLLLTIGIPPINKVAEKYLNKLK